VKAGVGGPKPRRPLRLIGWREIASLPDLGLNGFRAKIDTGARTTALHAEAVRLDEREDGHWLIFRPPVIGHAGPRLCAAPMADRRAIRNTSGVPEDRWVIRTRLALAGRRWLIEVALSNRGDMAFPMIVGRRALRGHRLLVDAGRSWLGGAPVT